MGLLELLQGAASAVERFDELERDVKAQGVRVKNSREIAIPIAYDICEN